MSWQHMIQRCLNPRNDRFKDYGALGITVCERWRQFIFFLADMGERPKHRQLSRIDHSRGYEPGNVRWGRRGDPGT